MKYSCEIVKDLLPLYHDGVCSEESTAMVEQHLSECESCKKYYTALCESDCVEAMSCSQAEELKKAESFHSVKRRIFRKEIIAALCAVFLLLALFLGASAVMKGMEKNVVCQDHNLTVSSVDGDLVARLAGSSWDSSQIKTVSVSSDGREQTYLFFCLTDNVWDDLTTSDQVCSEAVLSYGEKGADQIDYVYYYTGDYSGIENLTAEELEELLQNAVLLWSRG